MALASLLSQPGPQRGGGGEAVGGDGEVPGPARAPQRQGARSRSRPAGTRRPGRSSSRAREGGRPRHALQARRGVPPPAPFDGRGRGLRQGRRVDKDYPGLALERGLLFEETGQSERRARDVRRRAPQGAERRRPEAPRRLDPGHRGARRAGRADPARGAARSAPNSAEANHFLGRALLARGTNIAEAHALPRARGRTSTRTAPSTTSTSAGAPTRPASPRAPRRRSSGRSSSTRASATRTGSAASCCRSRAQPSDALEDLKTALEKRPSRYEAYATMALCYQDQGSWPEAEEAWRKAIAGQRQRPRVALPPRQDPRDARQPGRGPRPRWSRRSPSARRRIARPRLAVRRALPPRRGAPRDEQPREGHPPLPALPGDGADRQRLPARRAAGAGEPGGGQGALSAERRASGRRSVVAQSSLSRCSAILIDDLLHPRSARRCARTCPRWRASRRSSSASIMPCILTASCAWSRFEPGYERWLTSELGSPDAAIVVAERGGAEPVLAGYAYGRREPRDWNSLLDACGVVHDLYVAEPARRLGAGAHPAGGHRSRGSAPWARHASCSTPRRRTPPRSACSSGSASVAR